MTGVLPTAAVRPPSQTRSQRTLERILEATEALLEERDFQDISIQDIVHAADTSVGSFYARFLDKDALLTALYVRYDEGFETRAAAWRARNGPPPANLAGAARWTARYVVDSFLTRRHLLRALALHVRLHPGLIEEPQRERRAEQHEFLIAALVRAGARAPAARKALFFAVSTCRERILFADSVHARSVPQSDTELVRDTARMITGFLRPQASPTS